MSGFSRLPWPVDAHKRAQELLSAYIDGWISSPGDRRFLEGHLGQCATCREDLEGLRATVDLLQRVRAVPSPRRFTLAVSSRRQVRAPAWPLPMASVAAGLLLALIVAADATGLLPNGDPPVTPAAPAQERGLAAGRTLAPSAGSAEPPASTLADQGSLAPMGARGEQIPVNGPVVGTRSEGAPLPPRVPDTDGGRQKNPWPFVEAALGVITLALSALWAKKAIRGARP